MKYLLFIALIALSLTGCETKKGAFIESIETKNDIPTAIAQLKKALPDKGLAYIERIDHAKRAKKSGIRLDPKVVVTFGNPVIGSKLMQCNPSIGLDLPLRILFSSDYEGKVTIIYTNPEYWSLKHNMRDKTCLAIVRQASSAMQALAKAAAKKE